jgi:hypothetical protein
MTEVRKYVAKPIEVEAVQLAQYGDFVRAAAWINESKAKARAYFKPASKINGNVDTLVLLIDSNIHDVQVGDYVIRNSEGTFGYLRGDLFETSFNELPDDPEGKTHFSAWTGTGHPMPTGKPGKSLLGGAALQVPT